MTRKRTSSNKPAYVEWRNGRPRWSGSPALRRDGWTAWDMKRPDGTWMDWAEMVEAGTAFNARVSAARRGAPHDKTPPTKPAGTPTQDVTSDHPDQRTITRLINIYNQDKNPRWRNVAKSTRTGYNSSARIIEETFGDIPVTALTSPSLEVYYHKLLELKSVGRAGDIMRYFKIILNHAVRLEWITRCPIDFTIKRSEPRLRRWSQDELEALRDHADALGLFAIGDALTIAAITALRRSDILQLSTANISEHRISLRTSKTGKVVNMPAIRPLVERLDQMAERKAARGFTSTSLIVMDGYSGPTDLKAGRPYTATGDWFEKQFQMVKWAASGIMDEPLTARKAAALDDPTARQAGESFLKFASARRMDLAAWAAKVQTLRQAGLKPCPSIVTATFQDLRDTGITRLAEAGCTVEEIIAISGHSRRTVMTVLDHYIDHNAIMADNAMAKLQSLITAQGWSI